MTSLHPLTKRHARLVRRLERETYPPHMQLGSDLLDDVDYCLSCVALNDRKVVGYMLIEVEGNEAYVADIVRSKESTVSATEMLMWALGRLAHRPEIEYVWAECRSTSVHLIERCGLEVVEQWSAFCSWRGEEMTNVRVRLPAR